MQMRYRYRIEPTQAQRGILRRVFGCCRVVFNDALHVRDEAYQAGTKLSDSEIQRRVITQAKKTTERGWLAEVPSVALVQSVNDSRRAWRNFFDSHTGKRNGRKLGRPRMKSKRDNQVIHVEDLNVAGMVANRRLARAISDAGWGQFVRLIAEKAERYGRTIHSVSRWLASSKTCSVCQHKLDDLPLQVRQWTCPACRTIHDRDHNAAKVVLAAGRAQRLNASHKSGRDRESGSGGVNVRPQPVAAVDNEAGSSPTAA
jgi:IS605 OrfB family transposase